MFSVIVPIMSTFHVWLWTSRGSMGRLITCLLHSQISEFIGNTCKSDTEMISKHCLSWFSCFHPLPPQKNTVSNLDSVLKSRDITLPTKAHAVKAIVFPVVMYGYKVGSGKDWGLKNWCFQTVMLEKTFESPVHSKEIKPVYSKGNQLWIFTGRTDTEAETPILWPPDAKNWFTGKDYDAGEDGKPEEKGWTEGEIVIWHHWLNGHEFG